MSPRHAAQWLVLVATCWAAPACDSHVRSEGWGAAPTGTASGTSTGTPAGTSTGSGTTTTAAGGSGAAGGAGGVEPWDPMPDFALLDTNQTSPSYDTMVSPREYLERVSAWYFGTAT